MDGQELEGALEVGGGLCPGVGVAGWVGEVVADAGVVVGEGLGDVAGDGLGLGGVPGAVPPDGRGVL